MPRRTPLGRHLRQLVFQRRSLKCADPALCSPPPAASCRPEGSGRPNRPRGLARPEAEKPQGSASPGPSGAVHSTQLVSVKATGRRNRVRKM